MDAVKDVRSLESPDDHTPRDVRATSPAAETALLIGGIDAATSEPWWLVFVVGAWVAAGLGLLRLVAGLVCLWRFRRLSQAINDPAVEETVRELSRQCSLQSTASVRESPNLGVAAVAGWLQPLILLPATWRAWTADERRAVLAHELAHVKRRHFPAWLLCQLPLVAHYYHPLVHWLARRLRLEQEIAADRLAAQLFGERRRYAIALASIALNTTPPRGPFVSVGLFMSRPFLMRRIAMLRQGTESDLRDSRKSRACLLLLLAIAAVAVAGLRSSRAQDAEPVAEPKAVVTTDTTIVAEESAPPSLPTESASAALLLPPSTPPYIPDDVQEGPAAVSLFKVSRHLTTIAGSEAEPESETAWQVYCKTQLAAFKSHYVLAAALNDPETAKLPIIASQPDPVTWLMDHLRVGFFPGSEIMYIRLSGKADETEQLQKIVNAVAEAYEEEVVFSHRQRKLTVRDLLAKSLKNLNREVEVKTETYVKLAREQGSIHDGSSQTLREIELKRLDRVDAELMRLEDEFLATKIYHQQGKELSAKERAKLPYFEHRIAELNKRRDELEAKITSRNETSVDQSLRKRELERLEGLANDLSVKLEMMDIEASAPPRIEKIQDAVIIGVSKSPAQRSAK
jgi:beta-lactamase regulating signal transducer with metallopeptidase domain